MQSIGDCRGRQAAPEQTEDFQLAITQSIDAFGTGRVARALACDLAGHARYHLLTEVNSALQDTSNRIQYILGRLALGHVTARARTQSTLGIKVLIVHR